MVSPYSYAFPSTPPLLWDDFCGHVFDDILVFLGLKILIFLGGGEGNQ